MMTYLHSVPDSTLTADVVVIGAGVIGCAIAASLGRQGRDVLVLEWGCDSRKPSDDSIPSRSNDAAVEGLILGRRKGFGGSGTRWAAQCAPFDLIDFSERPWVAGARWPVGRDEITSWYAKASAMMKIQQTDFTRDHWSEYGIEPPNGELLQAKTSVFSPARNIANKFRGEFERSDKIRVLLGARAHELMLSEGRNAVDSVIVKQMDNKPRIVRTRQIVLAAGGIENARLLLASRSQMRYGIGQRDGDGLVGKHLHNHPSTYAARVESANYKRLQDLYSPLYRGSTRFWPRIPLPQASQRDAKTLNAIASVVFDYGANSGISHLRGVLRGRRTDDKTLNVRDTASLALHAPSVLHAAARRFVLGRSPSALPHSVWIQIASEQQPLGRSAVRLSDDLDDTGTPLPHVDWYFDDEERRAQRILLSNIQQNWSSQKLASVVPEPHMDSHEAWATQQHDAFHFSGTTRMADTRQQGVVDRDCRVFDIAGLMIAGTSILPTSSSSNPTFTALALSLRLAASLSIA